MVAFYGVSGFGRILVPVKFRLNRDEVGYIVEHSGASVLLVDPEVDGSIRGLSANERIVLDGQSGRRPVRRGARRYSPRPWEPNEQTAEVQAAPRTGRGASAGSTDRSTRLIRRS